MFCYLKTQHYLRVNKIKFNMLIIKLLATAFAIAGVAFLRKNGDLNFNDPLRFAPQDQKNINHHKI